MKSITVLITGVGSPGAPGIINSLKQNGERYINIIGVDMNSNIGGKYLVDKFYKVPKAGHSDFIHRIMEISIKENVQIILPLVTKELIKFSENKRVFEEDNIKINVMEKEILEITNNKSLLFESLRENGIPVPKYYIAKSLREIEHFFSKLDYPQKPICIKVTDGSGAKGVRFVDPKLSKAELFFNSKPNSMYLSYDELILTMKELESLPELMIMEFLPGNEYSVDLLVDNGEVIYAVCRRATNIINGIQLGCRIEKHDGIINFAKDICKTLKLHGNIGLDLKEDEFGEPRIMEINPRFTAGIVACTAAGVNLPYLGVKQILKEKLPACDINFCTEMFSVWQEIFTNQCTYKQHMEKKP